MGLWKAGHFTARSSHRLVGDCGRGNSPRAESRARSGSVMLGSLECREENSCGSFFLWGLGSRAGRPLLEHRWLYPHFPIQHVKGPLMCHRRVSASNEQVAPCVVASATTRQLERCDTNANLFTISRSRTWSNFLLLNVLIYIQVFHQIYLVASLAT